MRPTFSFANNYTKITTLDMHTGGEPLRIILEGFPAFENKSVLEIRNELREKYDYLRKAIMWEPRGHADMYGLLKVPPQRPDSDFGVIFMHNAGYSTMCGHGTIAIAKAAVELNWVKSTPPLTTIRIDAPCGQLTAFVKHNDQGIESISFENVPSFFVDTFAIELPAIGLVEYDLAYGGAFYAYLNIDQLGLICQPENYGEIIRLGRLIKKQIMDSNEKITHPFEQDLSFLYGTIFIDQANEASNHSRNVCVFADGEVDRCATGSGVSGRAAIHYAKKELAAKQTINIESIIGTTLAVSVQREVEYGAFNAVIPLVSGNAYFTGYQEFWIDPNDPLKDGFFIR
ncbi:MAG: proline racemase [Saprospiraceae bacterium]|nr:MAG: proline racemase [Saprospiraceae bacterium]